MIFSRYVWNNRPNPCGTPLILLVNTFGDFYNLVWKLQEELEKEQSVDKINYNKIAELFELKLLELN